MSSSVVCQPEWLAEHGSEEGVRVVDVRERWEYDSIGHVPGAVSIPFEEFRAADGADVGMLPGTERWGTLLSEAGIEQTDTIVAYDDEHGVFAARFLVTAIMYGHGSVRLLDGDFTAWSRQAETTTESPPVTPSSYEARVPDDRPLISAEAVRDVLQGDEDVVLVDTRSPAEFAEGHIEGAVNFDWRDLVDPDSRGLKSRAGLEEVLDAHGVTPDRRVILYCNTARRISHTYLVLRHLGFDRVEFFEGSLTEWRERDLPLVSEP